MYRAINLPVNNCYVLIHSSDILLIQESHQKPLLYFHNRNHKAAKILQTLELRTKPILDNHHSLPGLIASLALCLGSYKFVSEINGGLVPANVNIGTTFFQK